MKLGDYTFTVAPDQPLDLPIPKKRSAMVETHGGIAYFSWGLMIDGKTLHLVWEYCPTPQFDVFQAKYEADTPVTFDPEDGSGRKYTVEIDDLKGKYGRLMGGANSERRDVELVLVVLEEV